jgi:hypothetical protein
MSDAVLDSIRDVIQEDVGERGLRADPDFNLVSVCRDDFAAACRSLAGTPQAKVLIVTGFHITHSLPPCSETDGPLGALFLARALIPLGIGVIIATDGSCVNALHSGLEFCQLHDRVRIIDLPREAWDDHGYTEWVLGATDRATAPLTHIIALERVGPSHTLKSLQAQPGLAPLPAEYRRSDSIAEGKSPPTEWAETQVLSNVQDKVIKPRAVTPQQWVALCRIIDDFEREVPRDERDRCHSMRGLDLTSHTSPAHLLIEHASRLDPPVTTIGIGDGGNEIGMGKIAWDVIRHNIPNGAIIACRVPTDHLIVCGVSNWGAYGLGAGVRLLRGAPYDPDLFDVERERQLLQFMVDLGPLVDGRSGTRVASVDGLPFERYAEALSTIGSLVRGPAGAGPPASGLTEPTLS